MAESWFPAMCERWVYIFRGFTEMRASPGVLLIPPSRSIGTAIEGLLIVWLSWTSDDLHNAIRWLP